MKQLILALALPALALAAPAPAAVFSIAVDGTLAADARDLSDYLGQGTSLGGRHASLLFTFDTALGGGIAIPPGSPGVRELAGMGAAAPGSAVLTIGSRTLAIAPTAADATTGAHIRKEVTPDAAYLDAGIDGALADATVTEAVLSLSFDPAVFAGGPDLARPLVFAPGARGLTVMDAYFGGVARSASGIAVNFSGSFDPATTSVSVSPVPETGSWMLMVAGFGLIGATLRRRRTAIRFA